jgi:hypothetical protein
VYRYVYLSTSTVPLLYNIYLIKPQIRHFPTRFSLTCKRTCDGLHSVAFFQYPVTLFETQKPLRVETAWNDGQGHHPGINMFLYPSAQPLERRVEIYIERIQYTLTLLGDV